MAQDVTADNVRMVLSVEKDIPELMIKLAGGERKRGEWLSQLVRDFAAGKYTHVDDASNQADERLTAIEKRLSQIESELACRATTATLTVETFPKLPLTPMSATYFDGQERHYTVGK